MLRAKLFRAGRALTLSDVLPLFENMGVEVADERPVPDRARAAPTASGSTTSASPTRARATSTPTRVRDSFQDAFVRAWRGEVENDGLQSPGAERGALEARDIVIVRALCQYLRQAGVYGHRRIPGRQSLAANPDAVRLAGSPCSTSASIRGAALATTRGPKPR